MSVELVALAILMAAVTYPSRAVPMLLPGFDRLPPAVDEYLRLIGPGILAALAAVNVIVATDATGASHVHIGIELLAVLVCVAVVAWRRSLLPGLDRGRAARGDGALPRPRLVLYWRLPAPGASCPADRLGSVTLVVALRRRKRRVARDRCPSGRRHEVVRTWCGRRGPHQPGRVRRGVLLAARSLGLWQDHDAAHDRRLRGTDQRPHRAPGPGRDVAAAVQAQREHRVPELRPVPAPDHLRERGLRAPAAQGRRCGDQAAGTGDAGAGGAARLRQAQAGPDLGWPGTARGPRPGAHQPARRAAAG